MGEKKRKRDKNPIKFLTFVFDTFATSPFPTQVQLSLDTILSRVTASGLFGLFASTSQPHNNGPKKSKPLYEKLVISKYIWARRTLLQVKVTGQRSTRYKPSRFPPPLGWWSQYQDKDPKSFLHYKHTHTCSFSASYPLVSHYLDDQCPPSLHMRHQVKFCFSRDSGIAFWVVRYSKDMWATAQ